MDYYHREIENFFIYSKFSDGTKKSYRKKLEAFGSFLSQKINTGFTEIHLEKILELTDKNGRTIRYFPINSTLIDEFLFFNTHKGYSWLANCHAALKSFFKFLLKNYDFINVMMEIEFVLNNYKHMKQPQRILNRHDIIKLFQSIIKHSSNLKRDLLFFTLLFSTGCRKNELISITVQDIDFYNDCIYLKETKNKSSFYLILRDGIGDIIKKYCYENKLKKEDQLFLGISYNDVNEILDFYLEMAKLPKVTVHSVRHSFATLMYEAGASVTTIQQLLNHVFLSSTKTYIEPNYIRNYEIVIPENDEIYNKITLPWS